MENRPLSVAALLIALCLGAAAAWAADGPAPEKAAEWERRLAEAKELQQQGDRRQQAADELLAREEAACSAKFMVNDCRNAARRQHVAASNEARALISQGKALEREVQREERADKDARLAADAPRRAAENAQRAEETQALRTQAAADAAEKKASKARQAEAGAQKRAADAERIRKKQADHAAKVARKKAAAEGTASPP